MQGNRRRPNSPTASDVLKKRVRPSEVPTLDLVDVIKTENDICYIAVDTLGTKFKIPLSKIKKYMDCYMTDWADMEVPGDPVVYNARVLCFRLLNHYIDVNGTLRKRRETEKYKKDLVKWQYAIGFNTKAKLLQNGNMIMANDKLMYKPPKGCIEAIVPPKAELVDFSATQHDSTLKSVKFMSKIIIPEHCFNSCKGLVNVEIRDGTSDISQGAFSRCTALEQITIPKSVHKIGIGCFADCTNLKSVVFEGVVKYIGRSAFAGCSSLEEIRLPNGLSKIEECTFSGCSSLRAVYVPRTVKEIGQKAFSRCQSLKELYLPETFKDEFKMETAVRAKLWTAAKIIFYK